MRSDFGASLRQRPRGTRRRCAGGAVTLVLRDPVSERQGVRGHGGSDPWGPGPGPAGPRRKDRTRDGSRTKPMVGPMASQSSRLVRARAVWGGGGQSLAISCSVRAWLGLAPAQRGGAEEKGRVGVDGGEERDKARGWSRLRLRQGQGLAALAEGVVQVAGL